MNAEIVHSIPGRLRIKVPAARHQIGFFSELREKLLCAEGILSVTVNPTSASLVIVHDSSVDPLAVCRALRELAATSSAVHLDAKPVRRAYSAAGGEAELVLLFAKLLPVVFARHPIAQLAEIVGEPILRAVIEDVMRPRPYRLPAPFKQDEEVIAIAA